MKKSSLLIASLALFTMTGCWNNKPESKDNQGNSEVDNSKKEEVDSTKIDSTIYGQISIDDMGGGTFAIKPENTDTILSLPRTSLEGEEAVIYGPVSEGDKWAITVRHKGTPDQSLGTAINLTQVKKFTKAFHVTNGQLVLNDSDKVNIIVLNDDSLVYKDAKGVKDKFYRTVE